MTEYKSFSGNVPEHWHDDAREMGVSLSEYVRRIGRLGRRQWGHDHVDEPDNPHVIFDEQVTLPDEISEAVQQFVLRNLSAEDGLTENELAELVAEDIQAEVNDQLEALQQDEDAEYSPSKGGWVRER